MSTEQVPVRAQKPSRRPVSFSLDHLLKRTLFVLGIGVLLLIVFVAKFDHLADVNAIDYAQIARNLARGDGFTTSAVTPLALATGARIERVYDTSRPPLYVGLLSLAMRVGGATDRAVVFTSLLFLILTLVLVYLIARSFFDDGVAVFAVAICAISTGMVVQALSGLETTFLAFLVTLLFGLLLLHQRSEHKAALYWPALSGVLLGLCYLVRYEMLALAPALLLYWAYAVRGRRWPYLLITLGALAVVAMPWLIRTWLITGRPGTAAISYEFIMDTVAHPAQTLYRQYTQVPPLPISVALDHPLQMVLKLNRGVRLAYAGFPQMLNPYVLILFVASLFIATIRQRYGLVQWCLATGIFVAVAGMAFYTNVLRLLLAFAPTAVIMATAAFAAFMDEYAAKRWDSYAVSLNRLFRFLALCGWTFLLAYPMADYLFATPPVRQGAMVEVVKDVGKQGNFLMTDIPWHISWYGDRRTLLMPISVSQFAVMQKNGIRPDAIYLSPNVFNMPREENVGVWQQLELSRKEVPDGYTVDESWRKAGTLWRKGSPMPEHR